ncbi:BrxA family protein [Bifidobacterium sp. UTCIF-39]|uniref:BrxA family protein n=1 Tax=Bifidobacterium sp. UTCIF-39 TaxID=1465359 RepID=UPI0015E2F6C1
MTRQGIDVARAFLDCGDWEQSRLIVLEDGRFGVRTLSAGKRIAREAIKRLGTLSGVELRYLAALDTPVGDCDAIMWVAMCRYYELVGEFANEVLRDHYLLGVPNVTYEDYNQFVLKKRLFGCLCGCESLVVPAGYWRPGSVGLSPLHLSMTRLMRLSRLR